MISNIIARSIEEYVDREKSKFVVLNDIKRMTSNPLYIFKFTREFYSILVSLLSLYNQYSFFISITKSIPEKLLLKLLPDTKSLKKFDIIFDTVETC
ncbi:MAG: hypothetical protein QXN02_00215 [Ignisphaera sp.]